MSNATHSNLVAARLLQMSTEARASGNLEQSERLALAVALSDLLGAVDTRGLARDYALAVEMVGRARELAQGGGVCTRTSEAK